MEQQRYITTIMITPALGLIKCSFLIQYYLLFRPLKWVRISVWIGAIISIAFYVAVTITAFVLNSPWPGESLFEALYLRLCCHGIISNLHSFLSQLAL